MIYGWQRYLGIEQDFLKAQFYASFDLEEVYSEFFSREVILLGAEIEAAFKELCRRINGAEPSNIGDYKRIILGEYPGLVNTYVRNKQSNENQYPFREWDSGPLTWWRIYTDTKHNLVDRAATLGVALTMLQAYELLLFCIEATKGSFIIGYLDQPKLFIPDFQPGFAMIDDMQAVHIYDGTALREKLKQIAQND